MEPVLNTNSLDMCRNCCAIVATSTSRCRLPPAAGQHVAGMIEHATSFRGPHAPKSNLYMKDLNNARDQLAYILQYILE